MNNRREFLRTTALGVTAAAFAPRLFLGAETDKPGAVIAGAPAETMDSLLAGLKTASQLGVVYLHDKLDHHAPAPAKLTVHTQLSDPAHCGRNRRGWSVAGGLADSYTYATLRDAPTLGNRSQWSQFSFCSTQTGVAPGEHGLVEMRLCRGTTPDDLPLRVRVDNGAFYILGLNGDTVLAGDRGKQVAPLSSGTIYTLSVLLFKKAVFARLSGADLPSGAVNLVIPDRRRFIPGLPGFGLHPNAAATGGELSVFDWMVTPVGPAAPCALGVIGDSITAGNDGEPETESYVHLATQGLGQSLVLNTGSGGSTTTLDLARFPFEIAPFRPRIVWIEGGTNDIGNGLPAELAFKHLLAEAALVTWGGHAVFSTVPPRTLPGEAQQTQLARLNQLIRNSGRPVVDRHAIVCDPTDPTRLRPDFAQPDHIHITRAGHALIAAEALRVFKQIA